MGRLASYHPSRLPVTRRSGSGGPDGGSRNPRGPLTTQLNWTAQFNGIAPTDLASKASKMRSLRATFVMAIGARKPPLSCDNSDIRLICHRSTGGAADVVMPARTGRDRHDEGPEASFG